MNHLALSTLEIHLLGPYRVVVEGEGVDARIWSRRSATLLVKLLALQTHHQLHREQVMELLWPELDPAAATNNLHKTIHAARRALEPSLKSGSQSRFLLTRAQQIQLSAPGTLWIDVEQFEQQAKEALNSVSPQTCENALRLYAGDLLMEDLYEDWAATRREQLRALRQDVLVKLAHLYERRGDYQQSIERLKELLADDAANEEAHRQLMHLYAGTGSRHQALQQYQQCCEAVRRELETEPDAATIRLYDQIADGRIEPLPPREIEPLVSQSKEIDSLAILPLVNADGDADLEYLSDGITESLINTLSPLPGLKVMAWSTVSRYKGREFDSQAVGRKLKVGAVFTGRVLQFENRIVIRTEMVNVADGTQLWGSHFNREQADIFSIEKEISNEISKNLQVKLSGDDYNRLAKRRTDNIEAYHAYLKGRYFWYKRTEEALRKGIEYFHQAIDQDPGYATAYAGLSDSYALLALRGMIPARETFMKAKAAARKALDIDDTLGEAYASLAHVRLHDWDWAGLEEEFQRALELSPGHAIAYHWYSEYLMAMRRSDESIAVVKQAQEIDPLSPVISVTLAGAYYFARRYDEGIEHLRSALEVNPNHFLLHLKLGQAYLQKGMYEESIAAMRKAIPLSGRSTETLAGLAQVYAAAGMCEEAQNVLDELNEQSQQHYVSPYYLAKIYTLMGDIDRAFAWLEKGYAERNPDFIELKAEPMLDRLRSDPRFHKLLQRIGLEPKEQTTIHREAEPNLVPVMPRSIAVLPFTPLSREGRDEYLEMGIADALITRLSNLNRLAVRSIGSVRKYAEQEQDATTCGQELQVESVLEGNIQKLGERIRVTARLVRVADGLALWADKFDEPFTDIFAVEDSISEKVAAALMLKLTGGEKQLLTKRYTENTEAYHAYLRGRYYWNKRTDKAVRHGLEHFKKAIDLDPCYALAYTGLADSYLILGTFGIGTLAPREAFPRAKEAALKALEIDDMLAEAHTSLALVLANYDWNWTAAEREFKRAFELKPGYATARHWYAFIYLIATGHLEEAVKEEQKSQAMEPLSLIISTNIGTLLYLTRRYDQAIEQYHKTLDMDPNFVIAHWMLGLAYEQRAMFEKAKEAFQKAITRSGRSPLTLALAAHAYAISGEHKEALILLDELHELSRQDYVSPYRMAAIYAALNERKQAFAELERAFAERDTWMIWLNVDPVFDDLRSDRQFQVLVRRVGLVS